MPPPGVRNLTVLGEFKPFGLVVEALDGKPLDDVNDKYDYFLFDPEILGEAGSDASMSGGGDHELFIRGNRIIWTAGSRVYKRLTLSAPVIMACWSHLDDKSVAFLCVLQIGSLSLYSTLGDVVAIPLPCLISSIWPLPFGLLLQQAAEGDFPANVSFPPSSSSAADVSRPRREMGQSAQNSLNLSKVFDGTTKGDTAFLPSHLILRDPMEEPQLICIEERGKLNIMNDPDERTIWTSDQVPLMASYNKGKMQHSVWVVETVSSNIEDATSGLHDVIPEGVLAKQYLFHRIWQGKGAHTAACKVFLATDDDMAPIICFLLQGQKKLLSVRLQTIEINNDVLIDVKPDMSWSIPALSAAPVMVTRPRVKAGLTPFTDIIVLAPDNTLLLHSGKQCLCRYLLPSSLHKFQPPNLDFSGTMAVPTDVKIMGLADAVEGRVNVIINNGQIYRCALRQSPTSSLLSDCITALAEGISSSFYNHFLMLFWGDTYSAYLSESDSSVDSEWNVFCSIMLQMCGMLKAITDKLSRSVCSSSWEFLVNSQYHRDYCILHPFTISKLSVEYSEADSGQLKIEAESSGESSFYSELLKASLDSLHAVYESLKLDNLRKREMKLLGVLLCNISKFLGEASYTDYYIRDFPVLLENADISVNSSSSRTPPSLFRWLEVCLLHGCSSSEQCPLPPLVYKDGCSAVSRARKIVLFYSLLGGAAQIGRKISSGVYCNIASGSYSSHEEHTILAMVGENFSLQELDTLPPGVSLPLRHALDACRESPPNDWPAAAYVLLGRQDLALSCVAHSCKSAEFETKTNLDLISMSTPYMLHLHPVTIPSTVSDSVGSDCAKIEDLDAVDGAMLDGMEHIFNSTTQLRYGRDLRLNEVRRLLCSARPVAIQTSTNPSASDQDLQQAQLWQLAQRTTALPSGRGAFTLGTIYTLLTETFTVPKLVLAGQLPAQQNATVNLDPSARNVQELRSWPEFHNAVAAGLRLAPFQGKMSRTWIIYNKPEEPNAMHAGLLLALGLHGYLRVLSISDIYKYFSSGHESTTVGLMLGLAASYKGTMQPAITKAFHLHIPSRHLSSFPELELPTLVQSAALVSLGLLFEGSAHAEIAQILLHEIGHRSGGDNVLEREGYAVSAGFSLGLVALGRGGDTLGFIDALLDRLFQYIGGKELHNEGSNLCTLPDGHNRAISQTMDGTVVNVDVTAPGATIALALMFLKTEAEAILSRLSIPSTRFDLQYIRPDFIMLRVIARSLIMWSRVHPSNDWVQSQIPEVVKIGIKSLREDPEDLDETDIELLVLAYVNIVTGACISLGLRFAGSLDGQAQELLYDYATYFLNEIKPVSSASVQKFPNGLSRYVDRATLEICLHLIVLSLSVVMAGSGHLQTLRLLRFLRGRNSADGHSIYGTQMTVSLAIGFLFLGGGMRTFSTSNSSIAALLITLYPRLPTGPNDNRCHLQAFRHLYVLATEARWIQTVDVDTGLSVYAPLEVTVKATDHYSETSFCAVTPCILPERGILQSLRVCGPRYWPQVIDLDPEDKAWWSPGTKSNNLFNSGVLYIKRKVGACSYVDDPIGCQSLLSRAMHKLFGLSNSQVCKDSSATASISVDQLVSTFSSDPSIIAFAQLCCDPSWNCRSDVDFQEFCLQVLFECVSKDRPALLQVYLSLYTALGFMSDQVNRNALVSCDSLSVSSLKLAVTYMETLLSGRWTRSRDGIIQPTFMGSLRKRLEDVLLSSPSLKGDLHSYLKLGRWPSEGSTELRRSIVLSWYLQWFGVPSPSEAQKAVNKIKPKVISPSSISLLRWFFPNTHINAIREMDRLLYPS